MSAASKAAPGATDSKLEVRVDRPAFWSSRKGPVLSKDTARRQGQITHLAFELLGNREAALAFLNGDNAALGGRPLDVAMASIRGYDLVEQALRQSATKPGAGQ
jgi:hypothetical protein